MSVNGLTKARFDATIDGDFIMIPLKNRHTCVLPREIRVVLGYKDIKMFVANEYRPGSCEYDAVLGHEKEHMKINLSTFKSELPAIKLKTNDFLQTDFPMKLPSKNSDTRALERIQQALITHIRNMERKRDEMHAQLDSPESYQYTHSKCNNW